MSSRKPKSANPDRNKALLKNIPVKGNPATQEPHLSSNGIRGQWPPRQSWGIGASVPKAAEALQYADARVRVAAFPAVHDAVFLAALEKLRAAHPLETRQAQRAALWLTLAGWQEQRMEQVRDGLHRQMDAARGLKPQDRDAVLAGCRRELIAWAGIELRVRKERLHAWEAWQVALGVKPAPKPTRHEASMRALGYDLEEFPRMANRWDAEREVVLRQMLWVHFRTPSDAETSAPASLRQILRPIII